MYAYDLEMFNKFSQESADVTSALFFILCIAFVIWILLKTGGKND